MGSSLTQTSLGKRQDKLRLDGIFTTGLPQVEAGGIILLGFLPLVLFWWGSAMRNFLAGFSPRRKGAVSR